MYKTTFIVLLTSIVITGISINSNTSNNSLSKESLLFKISRNKDANEIWYTVNIGSKGLPDSKKPLDIFWLKKTAQNKTASLTWIQEHLAYGVKILDVSNSEVEFQFVSYPNRTFQLRNYQHQYQVFTKSNNKEIIIERIFINISGGSFLFPEISHVELYGIDPSTNEKTLEIIRP